MTEIICSYKWQKAKHNIYNRKGEIDMENQEENNVPLVSVTTRTVRTAIAGVLTDMHPYKEVPNLKKICDDVIQYLADLKQTKLTERGWGLFRFKEKGEDSLYNGMKKALMDSYEFRVLNISKYKWDQGVRDVDDKRNSGFLAVDRTTFPKQYFDFIDLDAAIRNIVNLIYKIYDGESDCMFCVHEKSYGSCEPSDCDECNSCICNSKFRNNYIVSKRALQPNGGQSN